MSFEDFDVESLSTQELLKIITAAGLPTKGLLEKSDYKAKALEAIQILKKQVNPETVSLQDPQIQNIKLSVYDCLVIGKDLQSKCEGVVVLLHGFQASNTDLVPLAKDFLPNSHLNIFFVLPQALKGGMLNVPQWWNLDIMKWLRAASGDSQLIRERPEGLDLARKNLINLINTLCSTYSLEAQRQVILAGFSLYKSVILTGFSQGAMTVLDTTLELLRLLSKTQSGPIVAATTVMSGAPIAVDEWNSAIETYSEYYKINTQYKLKLFISHGQSDPVIPVTAFDFIKSLFDSSHEFVDLCHHLHSEGHSIGCQLTKKKIYDFWLSVFK